MRRVQLKSFVGGVVLFCAFGSAVSLRAQIGLGTWVRQGDASAGGGMTMTVEACCNGGRKLTYHVQQQGSSNEFVMTIESPLDGTDTPMLLAGNPTGQTMGIKRVDDHHLVAVLKMNGQQYGTSRATISADGKTLTVESEITVAAGGMTPGKTTETWLRK